MSDFEAGESNAMSAEEFYLEVMKPAEVKGWTLAGGGDFPEGRVSMVFLVSTAAARVPRHSEVEEALAGPFEDDQKVGVNSRFGLLTNLINHKKIVPRRWPEVTYDGPAGPGLRRVIDQLVDLQTS